MVFIFMTGQPSYVIMNTNKLIIRNKNLPMAIKEKLSSTNNKLKIKVKILRFLEVFVFALLVSQAIIIFFLLSN